MKYGTSNCQLISNLCEIRHFGDSCVGSSPGIYSRYIFIVWINFEIYSRHNVRLIAKRSYEDHCPRGIKMEERRRSLRGSTAPRIVSVRDAVRELKPRVPYTQKKEKKRAGRWRRRGTGARMTRERGREGGKGRMEKRMRGEVSEGRKEESLT